MSRSAFAFNWLFSLFSIEKLSLKRDQWMRSFDNGNHLYYVDLAGGRALDNSYFPIETILPLQNLKFGPIMVRAPKDPDHYLRTLYTEKYKIIPPKEKQVTHEPVLIKFEDGTEYRNEME